MKIMLSIMVHYHGTVTDHWILIVGTDFAIGINLIATADWVVALRCLDVLSTVIPHNDLRIYEYVARIWNNYIMHLFQTSSEIMDSSVSGIALFFRGCAPQNCAIPATSESIIWTRGSQSMTKLYIIHQLWIKMATNFVYWSYRSHHVPKFCMYIFFTRSYLYSIGHSDST